MMVFAHVTDRACKQLRYINHNSCLSPCDENSEEMQFPMSEGDFIQATHDSSCFLTSF